MAFLEVKDLYKSFGDTKVLKGISFELEKGEVVSIIGSSGNGKTTLIRCLNFLETPNSGEIILDGEQIFPVIKGVKSNKTIGMVFQNFNLFPQYNALKNVTLALDLKADRDFKLRKKELKILNKQIKEYKKQQDFSQEELDKLNANLLELKNTLTKQYLKECKEQNLQEANALLDRVGLEDKKLNYPCELSGGQQQRVAIARALALKPDILCFDEPTSALDPELTGEVLRVIRGLRDDGWTMIIITHEMEFAKNVSDKVIFMSEGVIEEMGTPEQVLVNSTHEKTKAFLQKSLEKI
ncbi:MAG: amino acid ABC transporter ATP-binding protein [Clostridia bacterium]|nr:amino acid ABC transporter ATP-binding protein [Clostridia bacterium]